MSEVREFEPRTGTVTRPRAWLQWVPIVLFLMVLFTHLGFALMVLGGVGSLLLWRLFPERITGLLRVEPGGLSVDGVTVVAMDRIWQAVRFSRATSAVVYILQGRALPIQVDLPTDADARDLILALSMDDARTTARFRAWSGGMRARTRMRVFAALLPFGAVLVSLCFLSMGPTSFFARYAELIGLGLLAFGMFASLALGLAALSRRVWLVVGADGVLVRRAFRRSSFFPYREMRDVGLERKDVVWTRGSGSAAALRFGIEVGRAWFPSQAKDLAKACFTRIVDARARHLKGEATSDLATVLSRGDRGVGAWRDALETLLTEGATYRTAAVPPTRLWRVLEDPTQPEGARAGAAVALRASLDEEARGRLRVATAACASTELRRAFEATLEDDPDDVAIDRALQAFRADAR